MLLFPALLNAAPLELKHRNATVPLGPTFELFRNNQWQTTGQRVPNFGFTLERITGRIRIFNPFEELRGFIEHRYVHTDLVSINGVNKGDRVVGSHDDQGSIYPLFPIVLKPGENIVTVAVQSQEIVTLPLFLHFERPHHNYFWIMGLYVSAFIGLGLLLGLRRSKATYFYVAYGLLFLFNHFLIEGFPKKYFPGYDWVYLMNEAYFMTAIAYQYSLLISTQSYLGWNQTSKWLTPGLKLIKISSIGLMIAILLLPYHWLVIPYFINAGLMLATFVTFLIYQMKLNLKSAYWVSLSWIPSGIALAHSLYLFFTQQYLHSFGYLIGGVLQILIMLAIFIKQNDPVPNQRTDHLTSQKYSSMTHKLTAQANTMS